MSTRSKWIVAAVAALVLAGAATVAVIAATGGPGPVHAPSAERSPAPVPTVVPPTTAPGASADAVVTASEDLISDVLSVVSEVAADDTGAVLDSIRSVASAQYLSGVEAERAELADQGWTRTGTPRVDGVEIISQDTAANPATVTVRACVDSSDVVVHDAQGKAVTGAAPRAWNIFVLAQADTGWMIVGQTFTDDPAC